MQLVASLNPTVTLPQVELAALLGNSCVGVVWPGMLFQNICGCSSYGKLQPFSGQKPVHSESEW